MKIQAEPAALPCMLGSLPFPVASCAGTMDSFHCTSNGVAERVLLAAAATKGAGR